MVRAYLVLLLASWLPATALADVFRCPIGFLASPGQSLPEVALHCDAPPSKAARTESLAGPDGATLYVNVEEWTHNEGPRRRVHRRVFRDGAPVEVQTLGYGR